MDCPVCGLPLLYPAATVCPRCDYRLGENGPINVHRDHDRSWRSLRVPATALLCALALLGEYVYLTN
jgi:hypothetical protein